PLRSPDLNTLNLFLWGFLKKMVHSSPINDTNELYRRIQNACQIIGTKPGIFGRVRNSMVRKCKACVEI
ncbi:hypothetical protein EAI_12595, partial [Harpegnathos saltator]